MTINLQNTCSSWNLSPPLLPHIAQWPRKIERFKWMHENIVDDVWRLWLLTIIMMLGKDNVNRVIVCLYRKITRDHDLACCYSICIIWSGCARRVNEEGFFNNYLVGLGHTHQQSLSYIMSFPTSVIVCYNAYLSAFLFTRFFISTVFEYKIYSHRLSLTS